MIKIKILEQLCEYLDSFGYIYAVYTSSDQSPEYDFLEGKDILVSVRNNYKGQPLEIYLKDYEEEMFTIYFAGYHSHYLGEEGEFIHLCFHIKNFFEGKSYIVRISNARRWLEDRVCTEGFWEFKSAASAAKSLLKNSRMKLKIQVGKLSTRIGIRKGIEPYNCNYDIISTE